jgi:hypothetical protein
MWIDRRKYAADDPAADDDDSNDLCRMSLARFSMRQKQWACPCSRQPPPSEGPAYQGSR